MSRPYDDELAISGPFLRYVGVIEGSWRGSILLVTANDHRLALDLRYSLVSSAAVNAAEYGYEHPKVANVAIMPDLLDVWRGYHFWRYNLCIPMDASLQTCCFYQFLSPDVSDISPVPINDCSKWDFFVSSLQEKYWRWAFTSCNGFSLSVSQELRMKMGGLEALWKDLLMHHAEKPFLVQVGGGDQIYCDGIWKTGSLKKWLAIKGKDSRNKAAWNDELESACNDFYLETYINHFSTSVVRDALARIPSINILDDHDVWDGFGSYPSYLEDSEVFKNLKRVAYRFYLLFQHHNTVQTALKDEFIGAERNSYSLLRQLGQSMHILLVDTRSERTRDTVVSQETWDLIFNRLNTSLSSEVRHLVVVTGVPVVYPRMELADNILKFFGSAKKSVNSSFKKLTNGMGKGIGAVFGVKARSGFEGSVNELKAGLGKTGLMKSLLNQFGEPELADDLIDHWTHHYHKNERHSLILRLQKLAKEKNVRVTFIAGDVHCAAVGRLFGVGEVEDYRCMYQLVSSAIGNVPPPPTVIKSLNKNSKKIQLDESTSEEMLSIFKKDVNGKKLQLKKLLGRRNWCSVNPTTDADCLSFSLQVENDIHSDPSISYPLIVPPLSLEGHS